MNLLQKGNHICLFGFLQSNHSEIWGLSGECMAYNSCSLENELSEATLKHTLVFLHTFAISLGVKGSKGWGTDIAKGELVTILN